MGISRRTLFDVHPVYSKREEVREDVIEKVLGL